MIELCAESGLLVMLDVHVIEAGRWPDNGKVGGTAGREKLRRAWMMLAERFCDADRYWNVFAADLKNEPHGMFWGPLHGAAYDPSERWDTLAATLGETVHRICPRWVLVVEGVGHCADSEDGEGGCRAPAAVGQDMHTSTWWGENLQAASQLPVRVPDAPGKVLYSPHVYGPSVATQPYFDSAAFPRNLRAIWSEQWGHLTVGPSASASVGILIGEWGGRLETSEKERTWQHVLAEFIADPASRLAGSFCALMAPGLALCITRLLSLISALDLHSSLSRSQS